MPVSTDTSPANGAATPPAARIPAAQPGATRQARYADAFSNIVGVMMRDEGFGSLRLRDLEWLVLPPVMSGQWRLGQASAEALGEKSAGADAKRTMLPSAAVLWATVSPAVDKRLTEDLDQPIKLRADEWVSGDIVWLIVAAGDKRVVPKFLRQLAGTEFKGKPVKMRVAGPDGKVVVRVLNAAGKQAA